MKKMIGGIAAAAVGVSLALAPQANATLATIGERGDHSAINYRDELRYAGINHEDQWNAADLGSRLCEERYEGYTRRQVERHLSYSPDDYTTEQIVAMVMGAEFHFCPEYS
jgi:Protein of unknown function (DUF732)